MTRLIIRLNENWVHRHSAKSSGPVKEMVRFIQAHKTDQITVDAAAATSLALEVDEKSVDVSALIGDIAGFLADRYKIAQEELNRILRVEMEAPAGMEEGLREEEPAADRSAEKETVPNLASDQLLRAAGMQDPDGEGEADEENREGTQEDDFFSQPVNPENLRQILANVKAMPGAEQFASLCEEIHKMAPVLRNLALEEVVSSRHYLFAVDEGYGLTDYLNILTALLSEEKLFHAVDIPVTAALMPPVETADVLTPVTEAVSRLQGRIVSIDITAWMGQASSRQFSDFLASLADSGDNLIYVFRIPFTDTGRMEKLLDVLNDAMQVVPVAFRPLSTAQLELYAKELLSQQGFTADEKVWEMFRQRIAQEKSDGRFYGTQTLRKIVMDMIYRKVRSMTINLPEEVPVPDGILEEIRILPEDLAGFVRDFRVDGSAMDEISQLVCASRIREEILALVDKIEKDRKQADGQAETGSDEDGAEKEASSLKPMYMSFVGSPGTGKTTVARILGRLLKERGLLAGGYFFEHSAEELLNGGEGAAGAILASMLRDAKGAVLFIDDLSRLTDPSEEEEVPAKDALRELAALVSNPVDDIALILAGDSDEMKRLANQSQVLAEKIPYTLSFPDYTRQELARTFMNMLGSEEIAEGEGLDQAVEKYFEGLDDTVLSSADFSNARFVRNLFESARSRAVMRTQMDSSGSQKVSMEKEDFAAASSRAASDFCAKRSRRAHPGYHLGFV